MKLNKLIAFLFEDDPRFGKYLFGQMRKKPNPRNPEQDTKPEIDLKYDLINHYNGEPQDLEPWIDIIDKLEREGEYTDVLKVPSKYKYAYRVMGNVALQTLRDILGYEPTDYEAGVIYEEDIAGGTFSPREREHYSWTVDYNAFKEMQYDWGNLSAFQYQKNEFLVFLRAPIKGNGNRFLLNPDETKPIAGKYAYQKEIISVGSVKCDHIWYIPQKSDIYANDSNVKNSEIEALRHISDYEADRNKRRR